MGQLALTIVGGVLGSFVGMPQLGMLVGGMIGGALFAPTIEGPRLDDLKVSTSTYGNEIPRLYGTSRLAGNIIWSDGIKEHKKTERAGKGGPKQTTYSYTVSFAVAFCAGPITDLLSVWGDSKLLGQRKLIGEGFGTGALKEALNQLVLTFINIRNPKPTWHFYNGDESQLPDPWIEAIMGAGNVPAYRGLCYLVFKDFPLKDFGNRVPSISAELSNNASTSFLRNDFVATASYGIRNYAVDWQAQRLSVSGPNTLVTFDINSGLEINRYPVGSGLYPGVSQKNGFLFTQYSTANSRPMLVYSTTTGALIGKWGLDSLSLSHSPIGPNKGIPLDGFSAIAAADPHQDTRPLLPPANLWSFPYPTPQGESAFVVMSGIQGFNSFAIWTASGGCIGWMQLTDNFKPYSVFLSSQSSTQTSLIAWGPKAGKIRYYGISFQHASASFSTETDDEDDETYVFYPADNTVGFVDISASDLGSAWIGYNTTITAVAVVNCSADNSIVIFGTATGSSGSKKIVAKWDLADHHFVYITSDPLLELPTAGSGWNAETASTTFGYIGQEGQFLLNMLVVDLSSGKVLKKIQTTLETPWGATSMWDGRTESAIVQTSQGFSRIGIGMDTPGVSVAEVVTDICQRTGQLSAFDLDTSAIVADTVTGFVMSRGSAKQSLELLSTAYFFDGVETDFKIKFLKRGGAPVATLTQRDLAWLSDNGEVVSETRQQEVELPFRVTVSFLEPDRDYQTGSQFSKRLAAPIETSFTRSESAVNLPLSITATDGKKIADKLLKMVWRNRTSLEASTSWENILLDPSDVINVSLDNGSSYRMRIDKTLFGDDMLIKINGVSENETSYISDAEAEGPNSFPNKGIKSSQPLEMVVLNTPLLRDQDDTQGSSSLLYMSAYQNSSLEFGGGYIFESATGDAFTDVDLIIDDCIVGQCVNALNPTNSWGSIDITGELIVQMLNLGDLTLSSINFDQILAGGNAAIVGEEVIQFQTAEIIGTNRYKLTNLVRAARGTSYATNRHLAGERFLLLDSSYYKIDMRPPAEFYGNHYYKAVSKNQDETDVLGLQISLEPNDLKPYTPERVSIDDDATDVTIAWARRSRITDPIKDYTGSLHYKEGQVVQANFAYRFYPNKNLADKPWLVPTNAILNDTIYIYDGTGPLIDPEVVAPLDALIAGESGSFVFEVWENGFVEGFHKFVQFERLTTGVWNVTELY